MITTSTHAGSERYAAKIRIRFTIPNPVTHQSPPTTDNSQEPPTKNHNVKIRSATSSHPAKSQLSFPPTLPLRRFPPMLHGVASCCTTRVSMQSKVPNCQRSTDTSQGERSGVHYHPPRCAGQH